MSDDPYRAPQSPVREQASSDAKPEPEGLGGWLILVAIGLAATAVRITYFVLSTLLPIFTGDTWHDLTTSGTPAYHPLWGPLLVFEVCGNALVVALALTLLVLFFRKSPLFPTLAVVYLALNVVFVVGDYFMGGMIPAVAASNDPDSMKEVVRSLVGAAIWIPYMLRSKRVKNTFRARQPAGAPAAA